MSQLNELKDLIRAMLDPRIVAADAMPEVVLEGGPRDGESFLIYRQPPQLMELPVLRGILGLASADEMFGGPTLAYELVLSDGHPSRDDEGRYRYAFTGERRSA